MYNVVIYHRTVPNSKNQEKIDILKNFSLGISQTNDTVINIENYKAISCDIAIIQGWLGRGPITSPHLKLRSEVILKQTVSKKYVIVADSNLFLYADPKNSLHYLRYSFNGIFPNTGIYCDSNVDPMRWQKISKNTKISLKDWRINGNHILLLLQRNGGWSMGNVDIQDWAISTINTIRKFSDRHIIIRLHPGDKKSQMLIHPNNPQCKLPFSKDITLSNNANLLDDLKNCWAAVNYNSSPVVGAAIEGVPIFVLDPLKSQCKEIANLDLSRIENPEMFDRRFWIERLAMFHWNFDELKSGECWQHMRQFVK